MSSCRATNGKPWSRLVAANVRMHDARIACGIPLGKPSWVVQSIVGVIPRDAGEA